MISLQHIKRFQAFRNEVLSDRKSKNTIVTAIDHIYYTAGPPIFHEGRRASTDHITQDPLLDQLSSQSNPPYGSLRIFMV